MCRRTNEASTSAAAGSVSEAGYQHQSRRQLLGSVLAVGATLALQRPAFAEGPAVQANPGDIVSVQRDLRCIDRALTSVGSSAVAS